MDNLIQKAIKKNNVIAVVGASNNEEKYGYKILQDLLEKGYKAIPINPKEKFIQRQKVYSNIAEVPVKIDVVDIVVPPEVGIRVLEEVKKLYYKPIVWLQPGAESDELIEYAEKSKVSLIHGICLMLLSNSH